MNCAIQHAKLFVGCKSFVGSLPLTDGAIDAASRGDMRPALKEGLNAAEQWISNPSTPARDVKRLNTVARRIAEDLAEMDGPVPAEIDSMTTDELLRELTS